LNRKAGRREGIFCFAIALVLLSACASELPDPTPVTRGVLLRIADAPQTDPPALAARGNDVLAFWIGVDDRGVHHDARRITDAGMTPIVTLPLPPVNPFHQRAVASDGGALLFWLDQSPDAPDQAGLYAAQIDGELTVTRGPVLLSDAAVYDYAVAPAADGGAWAAWSGGAAAEPTLFARRIDAEGRPLERLMLTDGLGDQAVRLSGQVPALTYDAAGSRWLFWLAHGQVWRGRLTDSASVQGIEAITSSIYLDAGDRLTHLSVGSDGVYGCAFWNIERADGAVETWLTVGSFNDPFWAQPRRFMIEGESVRAASPLDSASSPLPIAALVGDQMVIAHMRAGQIETTTIASAPVAVLRPPSLTAAPGTLWLGWAQPNGDAAALNVQRVR